jgi:SAM-dependent methyltransferase
MQWPALTGPADAAYFDEVYRRSADPWRYASDPYELGKYRKQIDWLTDGRTRRLGRGLDVGCANGVFARMLCSCCDHVDAQDLSPVAIEHARRTLSGVPNVSLAVSEFPRQAPPPDGFDAVVIGEVLYYLEPAALAAAVVWMGDAVVAGARLIVANFANAERTPLVLDRLADALGEHLLRAERWPAEGLDPTGRAYHLALYGRGPDRAAVGA